MINLMTPMAEAAELAEKERMIESVSTLFAKDALKGFLSRAEQIRSGIRTRVLGARGVTETKDDAAAAAMRALEVGFAAAAPKKGGKRR